MQVFLKKVLVRGLLFITVVAGVFALRLDRSYYFSIPQRTKYSKVTWVENKLNSFSTLDNSVVFVGSSICFYGINDSLMNVWDSSETQYLNLGVIHHCNDITDVIVQHMVEDLSLHPKKVMMCLKADAIARDIHNMFPLAANSRQIIETSLDGNMLFPATFLKRVAWNSHAFSRFFKFDVGEDSLVFSSEYGYEPQEIVDSSMIEKKYNAQKSGMESVFSFIHNESMNTPKGMKQKILDVKRDYIDNEKFQNRNFENTARLLEEHGIDFDIILYPNLVASRAGKQGVMSEYARKLMPGIDYDKHKIIVADGADFSDASSYVDMNHLSPKGAEAFSRFIYEYLKKDQ